MLTLALISGGQPSLGDPLNVVKEKSISHIVVTVTSQVQIHMYESSEDSDNENMLECWDEMMHSDSGCGTDPTAPCSRACPLHPRWESHEINAHRPHISTALSPTHSNSVLCGSLTAIFTHVRTH